MQVDKSNETDPRSAGSDPSDPGSTPSPSSKVQEKLQIFAEWRIDPSSIEFEDDASEFRGGHATVSRAYLVPTSGTRRKNNSGGGATDKRKTVAVKKLKIENGEDTERVLGLALREAGFLTQLSHRHVIKLEGFVEDLSEDRVWLVFPWADNGNLKDFVASEEWEIPERISLIDDVAKGVEYLHTQDPPIYHGDLKSVNVLVNSKYRAVITDFGSARRLANKEPTKHVQPRADESQNQAQPELLLETKFCEATNTVTLTGNKYTLRWAAPELLIDDEPGLWSDIWALGWIFYEVMTNAIPFQNVQKDSVVVIHVIQGNLPSAADHTSMVLMRALYSLMITCWNIDPSKRPTAEDCSKSMNWMPMVVPGPRQASNSSGPRTLSHELLIGLGDMHRYQNDYINASKYYTEALGICTGSTDSANRAEALDCLAKVRQLERKYNEAITLYSEAIQILANVDNGYGRASALRGLAHVHLLQAKYSEAIPFYSEARQISADIGDKREEAHALWGLAEVHRNQKQYSTALELFSETLQIYIDNRDRNGRARALMSLADVHRNQDQHEDAIRLYEQAAGIYEEIGKTSKSARALRRAARARQKLKPEAE